MKIFGRIALVAAVVALGTWLVLNREVTTWEEQVPGRLHGFWTRIGEFEGDIYGVRALRFGSAELTIARVHEDGSEDARTFPVHQVSITTRPRSDAGEIVLFYGETDDQTLAEHRLQVYFGPSSEISVQDIVPTGSGADHWFDVGEFVRLPE